MKSAIAGPTKKNWFIDFITLSGGGIKYFTNFFRRATFVQVHPGKLTPAQRAKLPANVSTLLASPPSTWEATLGKDLKKSSRGTSYTLYNPSSRVSRLTVYFAKDGTVSYVRVSFK